QEHVLPRGWHDRTQQQSRCVQGQGVEEKKGVADLAELLQRSPRQPVSQETIESKSVERECKEANKDQQCKEEGPIELKRRPSGENLMLVSEPENEQECQQGRHLANGGKPGSAPYATRTLLKQH